MGVNSHANDAMIRRLENELNERNAFVQGLIANVQDSERDLNDTEKSSLGEARARMGEIKAQIDELEDTARIAQEIATRAKQVDAAITTARRSGESGPIEYRTAGAWMVDLISSSSGNRDARERLELYERAAAHQKTGDNLGIVPDPIVGSVINFIDAARPLVSFLGPRNMPSATWYRPKVTQHVTVGVQGTAGAAADEKAELLSQKMTITRLTGNAVTYGGYVNVSRQNIDFSSPDALDTVINDLAAQYAIQTEAALGAALIATTNTIELGGAAGSATAAELAAGLWSAAAAIYTATKGQGRVALGVPPSKLGAWGSVFAPVNPQNAQSTGFNAGDFNSGLVGSISGIPVYVSAGLSSAPATTYGIVLSSAAVEVYEQRVGSLQAIEPSVLGTQVAYAGYFTPMTVETGGVQEIVNVT
jgi:HK97 family phage major capsid protein